MSDPKIKVMIVDDSQVARDLLTFIVESDPHLKVTGYAMDGLNALTQLKNQNPDVVIMDILMPKMNGFEATKKIMETSPVPIIIVSANYNKDEVEKSFKAIQVGALAILSKPSGPSDPEYANMSKEIQETIRVVSDLKLIRRRPLAKNYKTEANFAKKEQDNTPQAKVDLAGIEGQIKEISLKKGLIQAVAIGASLGGPQAIAKIIAELPASFPVPIFIVQHISIGFINGFVTWLRSVTSLNVSIAQDGQIAKPGCIYIAPETSDMEISNGNIMHLKKASSKTIHPSLGPLFASMARTYGPNGIGVILTGMGKDGAMEMLQMKNSGAITIAQDEESCVVFGMPKEAIAFGGVKYVLPLVEIAPILKQLVGI